MRVFCCGSNGGGQLGLGNTDDQHALREVTFPTPLAVARLVSVRGGGNHTVALVDGRAYATGQCGLWRHSRFVEVPHDNPWRLVSCGWEFSVLVDLHNRVYVIGAGPKGELGLGETTVARNLTPVIAFDSAVVALELSVSHTVLRLANGEFYGWGVTRKGQLGAVAKSLWVPTKINWDGFDRFALGRGFTVVYNSHQVCVKGTPLGGFATENLAVLAVLCMWSSVHIKTGGAWLFYGNNSHGQRIPGVTAELYAVGSEHGLAAAGTEAWAWGWGEHGNCGTHTGPEVTFGLNQIYSGPHRVVGLAGGCATSWVITE